MSYATIIVALYLLVTGALAYFLSQPFILPIALLLLPNLLQSLPWGLLAGSDDEDEDVEDEESSGKRMGFLD